MCPGNERLCSMPAYMTNFIVTNPTNQAMDATFLLSVENFIGYDLVKTRTGVQDALLHFQRGFKHQKGKTYNETIGSRKVHGLIFHQDDDAPRGDIRGELCFALAAEERDGIIVTAKPNYFVGSESNLVESGIATGKIHDANDDAVSFTGKEPLCGALCASLRLEPGETKSFSLVTVMDFPHVEMGNYQAQKKYTTFFPDAKDRSRAIAKYLLANRERIYVSEWAWRESMHREADSRYGCHRSACRRNAAAVAGRSHIVHRRVERMGCRRSISGARMRRLSLFQFARCVLLRLLRPAQTTAEDRQHGRPGIRGNHPAGGLAAETLRCVRPLSRRKDQQEPAWRAQGHGQHTARHGNAVRCRRQCLFLEERGVVGGPRAEIRDAGLSQFPGDPRLHVAAGVLARGRCGAGLRAPQFHRRGGRTAHLVGLRQHIRQSAWRRHLHLSGVAVGRGAACRGSDCGPAGREVPGDGIRGRGGSRPTATDRRFVGRAGGRLPVQRFHHSQGTSRRRGLRERVRERRWASDAPARGHWP